MVTPPDFFIPKSLTAFNRAEFFPARTLAPTLKLIGADDTLSLHGDLPSDRHTTPIKSVCLEKSIKT
jgi:hypothetical protein